MIDHSRESGSIESVSLPAALRAGAPRSGDILSTVMDQVRAVGKERAKNLSAETNLYELGLDSLERLDVMSRLEQSFQIRVPEQVLMDIESCQDAAEAIRQQLAKKPESNGAIAPENYVFEKTPEYVRLQETIKLVNAAGESDPFFTVHEAISNNATSIGGRQYINYSGNNYLGMSGDPRVTEAAKKAIDKYGTSVSASRVVSGTRPVHIELEQTIREFLGAEDVITFTSGHSTNTVVIGHLLGAGDLVIHDELVHNSIVTGAQLSGARRRPFPHNDWQALDAILTEVRGQYRKVLVIIEGVYSMDGDYAEVAKFIAVKKRHHAWLMIDEAHSIGTLGATGRGITEHFGIDSRDIDVWMGTLSKALGACGGFIAGRRPLIKYLKYTCPGVVFTIGLAPSSAAAALEALRIMQTDSSRVKTLHARAAFFLGLAKQHGFDTGSSGLTPIVPVILGNSLDAIRSSRMMRERGISVQPILHPAVNEAGARLRFFINCLHTEEQLQTTADTLADVLRELNPRYLQHLS